MGVGRGRVVVGDSRERDNMEFFLLFVLILYTFSTLKIFHNELVSLT